MGRPTKRDDHVQPRQDFARSLLRRRWWVIILVAAASYVILNLAARGASRLSPIATRIAERVMGLLLAAVAFQFMLNALQAVVTQLRP